ncbi:DUF2752 domain-containing protein [candidate division KSB1 bacterium]
MIKIALKESAGSRKKAIIIISLLAATLSGLYLFNPDSSIIPNCQFRALTGYSCFTCGMTRSLSEAAHLNLADSFGLHIMGPVIVFSLFLITMKFTVEAVLRREIVLNVNPIFTRSLLVFLGCVWLAFWLVRFFHEHG